MTPREREAFEAAFLREGNGHAWLARTDDGSEYFYHDTESAWHWWQAAAARYAGVETVLREVRSWRRSGVGLEARPTTDPETLGERIDKALAALDGEGK